MRNSKLVAALVTICMLTACQQNGATSGNSSVNKQNANTAVAPIGGTPLNTTAPEPVTTAPAPLIAAPQPAITNGSLLGNTLSNSIGQSLDSADRVAYDAASQHALETGQPGQTMPWKNPLSGNSGTITPQNYYQNSSGQYCRQYTQTIVAGQQQQSATGQACRQADGTWQVI